MENLERLHYKKIEGKKITDFNTMTECKKSLIRINTSVISFNPLCKTGYSQA